MLAIGVDIGGTSIKVSAVNENGKVLNKFVIPVNKEESQDETIDNLIKEINSYIENNDFKGKISGIGLGIPGSVDTATGEVIYCSNLGWKYLPIVKKIKEGTNLEVKITNDANAAALAESKFGVGKIYKDIVMITIGTGIGGGIIIDNKLYEGFEGKGAELGHVTLIMDGLPCGCGRKGCFEKYASATALINQTKEAMEKNKDSLLNEVAKEEGKVNGKVAFIAAKKGDKVANQVIDQYVKYLSEGLLNICNVFRPQCIVLSGGIANQGEYLITKVIRYMESYNFGYPFSPKTSIKIAEVGYDSGIIGAASLFFQN